MGAPCSYDNDCDAELHCRNDRCDLATDDADPGDTLRRRQECSWPGHCMGDSCQSDDDCDGVLHCRNDRCDLAVDEPIPSAFPSLRRRAECSWPGHCAGASCQSSDDCDGELECVNKVCSGSSGTPTTPTNGGENGGEEDPLPTPFPSPSPEEGSNSGSGVTMNNVLVTFYGFDDNTNAEGNGFGGDNISHPGLGPKRHARAKEGTGAFNDPITFASDPNKFAPGTIIYVPYVKKYYIMEDDCTECIKDEQPHVDLWMGPNSDTNGAVMCCENVSGTESTTIIKDAGPGFPVNTKSLFTPECAARGKQQDDTCDTVNNGGEF
ncbi:hypothetical protein HK104_008798 [Borealophlyctis nickersoniae]|nr:hypothetical protein HK104_008798 [Borealophlyctis nickersoniae]